MLAQLPLEIVDQIVGYLDFRDVRPIARVCSALRLPAQLRLFRYMRIGPHYEDGYPLSSPHLLQYPSRLMVGSPQGVDFQPFWPHLPAMHRLRTMKLYLTHTECSRMLSALENLGSAREIALILRRELDPNVLISDNPLPVHSLKLSVDASNHQVVKRLIQKCSQSLRQLHLRLMYNITPPSNFLPHLYEFSAETRLYHTYETPDLVSWFPFLGQHPTITRLSLGTQFTLTVQPSPDLLPNLQFLSATPTIIERLIPGRPVTDIFTITYSQYGCDFPLDVVLQPLQQPFVPVTTLELKADATIPLPSDLLVDIVQALPKLRKFTLEWTCYEIDVTLQGHLPALGRCRDLVHIRMRYLADDRTNAILPAWSKEDFIRMVQKVQENGAANLWSFEIEGYARGYQRHGCEAMRVGWLDVPRQPTLRGEWRFAIPESSESDVPLYEWDTSVVTVLGRCYW